MSEDKKLSAKELKALRRAAKVEARPDGGGGGGGQRSQGPGAAAGGSSTQQRPGSQGGSNAVGAQHGEHSRGLALNASTGSTASRHDQRTAESRHKAAADKAHAPAATLAPAIVRPQLFSHLDQKKRIASDHIPKDIHPTVFTLALRYSSGEVSGSNARCLAMLHAFKDVIRDYTTPQGTTLARNLSTYLSQQINYLVKARPLSVSMGTAIRYLKREISTRSIDKPDDELKRELHASIDTFIKERIEMSGQVIARAAAARVRDGDVVLVYAYSTTVLATLIEAVRQGRHFSVIVVDSRPRHEGRIMLQQVVAIQQGRITTLPINPFNSTKSFQSTSSSTVQAGVENTPDLSSSMDTEAFAAMSITNTRPSSPDALDSDHHHSASGTRGRGAITEVTFVQLSGLDYIINTVTKVFLGAHALLANGALYSRAGTAVVAAAAAKRQVPCVVLCETYKFSERVLLDSFVVNELGPDLLPPVSAKVMGGGGGGGEADAMVGGKSGKDDHKSTDTSSKSGTSGGGGGGKGKKDDPRPSNPHSNNAATGGGGGAGCDPIQDGRLTRLELLYDVTPAKFLTLCVSELGSLPTTAVPAALREQNRDLGVA